LPLRQRSCWGLADPTASASKEGKCKPYFEQGYTMQATEHLCKQCGRTFPRTLEFFHRFGQRKDGLRPNCKECQRKAARAWKQSNPERKRAGDKRYSDRLRLAVLRAYCGGDPCCQCCGERHIEFLDLDHVKGDGAEHRKTLRRNGEGQRGDNRPVYRWARDNSYPDTLQVLCHNCNRARFRYGRCPHERERCRVTHLARGSGVSPEATR
jgi:hypothetical protein